MDALTGSAGTCRFLRGETGYDAELSRLSEAERLLGQALQAAEKSNRALVTEAEKADGSEKENHPDAEFSDERDDEIRRQYAGGKKIAGSSANGMTKFSNRLVGKTFLPYNESKSEANELSTRWAHKEDTHAGDQKLVSYHGRCYLIEAFDDSPLGYQIVQALTERQYKQYVEEVKYGRSDNATIQERLGEAGMRNREGEQSGRNGYSPSSTLVGQQRKSGAIQGMGAQQNAERASGSEKLRDNQSSGKNQQGNGAVTDGEGHDFSDAADDAIRKESARKRTERQLQQENERLKAIRRAIPTNPSLTMTRCTSA